METKKLEKVINKNFGERDLLITLTYNDKNVVNASKNIKTFIRNIRKYSCNPDIKYIYTTEGKGNIHHNVLIERIDEELIRRNWNNGKIIVGEINCYNAGTELAKYLLSGKNTICTISKNMYR